MQLGKSETIFVSKSFIVLSYNIQIIHFLKKNECINDFNWITLRFVLGWRYTKKIPNIDTWTNKKTQCVNQKQLVTSPSMIQIDTLFFIFEHFIWLNSSALIQDTLKHILFVYLKRKRSFLHWATLNLMSHVCEWTEPSSKWFDWFTHKRESIKRGKGKTLT